jgi:hypothetical protein
VFGDIVVDINRVGCSGTAFLGRRAAVSTALRCGIVDFNVFFPFSLSVLPFSLFCDAVGLRLFLLLYVSNVALDQVSTTDCYDGAGVFCLLKCISFGKCCRISQADVVWPSSGRSLVFLPRRMLYLPITVVNLSYQEYVYAGRLGYSTFSIASWWLKNLLAMSFAVVPQVMASCKPQATPNTAPNSHYLSQACSSRIPHPNFSVTAELVNYLPAHSSHCSPSNPVTACASRFTLTPLSTYTP